MYKIKIKLKGSWRNKFIEADTHQLLEGGIFSIIGSDQRRYLIPVSGISYIEFDKNLNEIILKAEKESK